MFNTGKFAGRTAIITGASRGIGKEIALKLAKDGANIVIAAKTVEAHPKLPGTIYTAAKEIEAAGGRALPCIVDVRDETSVERAVDEAVKKFGGVDILINNASAISLTGTTETPMKRYDLMNQINARGTFLMSQKCIPYLRQGKNPHILQISPPLLMEPIWFQNHVAYTMAKYGMSMCTLGMSEELRPDGIAVNSLWPLTAVWTAAMEMLSGGKESVGSNQGGDGSRKPAVMADAAYAILSRNSREYTGNFAIDQDVLEQEGVTNFDKYAINPASPLMPDFFVNLDKYKHLFPTDGPTVGNLAKKGDDGKRQKSRASLTSADVDAVLERMRPALTQPLADSLNALIQFTLTNEDKSTRALWVDLRAGKAGSFGDGDRTAESAVQMRLATADFGPLFTGELGATQAFMTKRLQIKGDMTKALKLESIIKKLKGKL